ncbi:MAG: hypothetical protein WC774_02050 [Candidatus Gracilibacteria bacterium]
MSLIDKIEEISSQKKQERQVLYILEEELIKFGGFKKSEIKIVRIEPNLFSVGTEKNISFYCDEKGNISFNIGYTRKQPFFQEFLITAGYREVKNANGEYKLFRINKHSSSSRGKDIYEKEIPLHSREYYTAWEDIEFYRNKLTIDIFKKPDTDKNYHPLSDGKIQNLINAKSLRVKDLIFFLEHKQISPEIYNTHIQQLIEQLPQQIGDIRLDRIQDIISVVEIQDYLSRKIITKEMYAIFSKQIKLRDELLGNKELSKDENTKEISSKIGIFKQIINKK